MSENRYSLAGWMAIVGALLFVVNFVAGIAEAIVMARAFGIRGASIGPTDAIGVIFTIIALYVLVVFRRMLHERYDYHGIDTLITFAIVWHVVSQIAGLGLGGFLMVSGLGESNIALVSMIALLSVFMLGMGILDILIGVRLIQAERPFAELIKIFAYLSLVAGILEATIFLSPLALLLVPISMILMGLILLKEKEDTDFV